MGQIREHPPVQLIAGLIANPAEGFERARRALVEAWGAIDMESPVWPFTWTDYYTAQMGEGLLRQFVAFEELAELEGLERTKILATEIEERLAADSKAGVKRPVNIDPGYVCQSKLVLFSTKDFAHRIHVGGGIFAESTLEWRGKEFVTHAWTFPDYRTAEYRNFFAEVRVRYSRKLKPVGRPSRFDSEGKLV